MMMVQVACSGPEEAERLAEALLQARLVACASVGAAVSSRYWWEGKLERATEVPLLLKTTQARFAEVEAEVRRLHSYAVPEIAAVEVDAVSADYQEWLEAAVGKR